MIEKGNYIRKKNFEPIGKNIGVLVQSIYTVGNNKHVRINGFCNLDPEHIEIISKEEAERLNELYGKVEIAVSLKPEFNSSCYREDNGEAKSQVKSETRIKILAFKYQMKNPEGNYQPYKCETCGNYHIGKTR